MILDNPIKVETKALIVHLENRHRQELFDLVNLVQPGYFKTKTMELGDYYGIFSNSQLVAVTGERMKMNGFTELSATPVKVMQVN
jgi:hypothetical protein